MNKNGALRHQDKTKTTILEVIIAKIIQSTLHFQKQLIFNSSVQIIVLFVCNFQILFFVIYQDYGWQVSNTLYANILMALFRIDLLLSQYDISFQFIIYLIFLLIVGQKFLMVYSCDKKNQIKLQMIQYYIKVTVSMYVQLFFNFLLIPLTTFNSMAIIYQYNQLKDNNLSYLQIIFGIIIFIIVQIEALIHLIINQQSIDTKIVCFEKLKITSKDFLVYSLNMTSVIVFTLGDSIILRWVLHILIFLSSFLIIQNQLEAQGIIHQFQKNIVYLGNSFCITYIFFSAIKLIIDSQSFNHLLFTSFAFPIILQIVHSIDSEINAQLFYKSLNKQNINMHAISQLLIQQQNNIKLPKMLKIYIFNQHKSKCRDSQCFCHHEKLIADPRDTAPITLNIQQNFAQAKLKLFRKQLFLNNKAYLDELIYHTIIYGALLANYGWIIQSVKHFNQLLYGRSQHSKNSSQSVNQSIMAPSSFSATIRNDSSSQSLTDPEKKYAEVSFKNLQRQSKHIITYQLKLDFIQTQKILFLLDSIKFKLKNIFGGQQLTSEQHELSEHIQNFMQQEFKMEQYLNEIKKILKLKIKYFESSIQLLKKVSITESMKQIQQICRTLIAFQQKLYLEYERYPSKRLQSLQVFYEAEVFKNYLQAYKLINQATMSENQLFILNQNFSVNFYTNQISYLLCTVDEDLQHIDILQQSSNFKKMVDYKMNEEFDFQSLLLQFIAREHPIMVSKFFKTGKSKYYKQFSQTFIKNKKGIAKPIIFSFDNISQLKQDKITIVGIFQEVEMEFSFVMVDVNNILGGMTKSFLLMLGFNPQLVDNINDFSQFYKLKISRIFPKFEELVENELTLIRANNVETHFIDLELYLGIILSENADTFQKQESLSHKIWDNQKFLKSYQSNITIHKNELYGYHYYIISIDSIFQSQAINSLSKTEQLTQLKSIRRDLTEDSEDFEISQLNLSIGEAMPRTINLFTIRSREGYSLNTQRGMSIEKNLNLFEVKQMYHEDLLEKIDQQIISPNKSTSQLIEKQQNKLLQSQQQDYFTNNTSQKQIKVEFNAIEKSQKNIDDQQNEKGNDTKRMTEYGYQNSYLLTKFTLINDITKEKEPKMLKYLLSVILIIIAIQFICPVLVIFILNQDILQFISNIEMISFHASIQGPHDLFFLMRNTITVYQQMQREGFFPLSILSNLTEPYYLHVGLGYTELKDSLYKQLNNQYLEHFLDDEQMTLQYMKNDQSTIYPVGPESFRECLLQILQYQYAQMRTFQKRQSTSGQPYQIFLFANYYNIQDKLEAITYSILEYTLHHSFIVSQKWITIWIIFSISLLVFLIIQGITYHKYLKSYDEFLKLLSYIDKPQAQLEIEKLQQLINVLSSNQEYSYSYKFDLQHQEQIMKNCIELNKIQKTKKLDNEQQLESTRKNNLIFWIMIALIFLTYALIVEMKNEDYLSKFDETTNFYFLIQNLKFRSGCLFLYREHLLRWTNFTFLTSHDQERVYLLIDKAQESIQDYLTFTSTFQPNQYLISDGFATFFKEQQTHNLCDYLDEEYLNWMEKYCEKAFEGQIQNGAIPVLNYISNQIRSQQAINNFTKRAEVQLYELEGAQIILRAFFKTSSQFQNGLSDITLKENNFVLIITFIFLIYLSIFLFIIGCYLKPQLNQEYAILRRMVFLIPSQILLGDDTFERCLKQIALNQGLK